MNSSIRASVPSSIASIASLVICIGLVTAAPAHAQDAAAAAVVVPPMNCPKPGAIPTDQRSPERAKFQDRVTEYETCINSYAKTQGAKAGDLAAQSRAYGAAANKAIDEFNAYVAELNKKIEEEKAANRK